MSSEAAEITILQSPLADFYTAREVSLVAYHGANAPARFGDPGSEYAAVGSAAGIFDFCFRSKFTLAGEHRTRFLHRIISNDVKSLEPGQGVYATLLSAQGRILADFYVYADTDRLWVDIDADLAQKAIAVLRRYVIGDRVVIEPSDLGAIGVEGPESRRTLETLLKPESSGQLVLPERDLNHVTTKFEGNVARVVRRSSTGQEGYEVWLAPASQPRFWTGALEAGVAPCGVDALEALRIEAGIPRYGPDFGEDTLPLEAGLLNALSFNKGCYIGQEIVERARSRGHVNWKLVGFRFPAGSAVPAPGNKLYNANKAEIGEITSSCFSPRFAQPLALGYVRREVCEPGTPLTLAGGEKVEVAAPPFVG